jgi:RNA polymerase sigma-70 factor (ECF subfamily)
MASSDEALMQAYIGGDTAAFDELFRRYAPVLLRLMRRETSLVSEAQDLVQQTFLQLHRARHDYDPSRPLRGWLFTIALNVRRGRIRQDIRHPEQSVAKGEELPIPAVPADTEQRVAASEAWRMIQTLSPAQREVIELHWQEGLSFSEIASALGQTLSAVKVRAHRAYAEVRRLSIAQGVQPKAAARHTDSEDER